MVGGGGGGGSIFLAIYNGYQKSKRTIFIVRGEGIIHAAVLVVPRE